METGGRPLSDIPAINRFLSYCRIRTVPSKTVLIHAGDVPDVLYYVIKGSVEVLIEDSGRGSSSARWASSLGGAVWQRFAWRRPERSCLRRPASRSSS